MRIPVLPQNTRVTEELSHRRTSAHAAIDFSMFDTVRKAENFPVLFRLFPKKMNQALAAFYAFARGADSIADDGKTLPEKRHRLLVALQEALHTPHQQDPIHYPVPYFAAGYRQLLDNGMLHADHGQKLLEAFIQDTQKQRYRTLDELIAYCERSAAPVGRALLELAEEDHADHEASDAICIALQLLNHLQDLRQDAEQLDRIYIPQDLGVPTKDFTASVSSPQLRLAIARILLHTDLLLRKGRALAPTISSFRIRAYVCTVLAVAESLSAKLAAQDPLQQRVALNAFDKLKCVAIGLKDALTTASRPSLLSSAYRTKSSFFLPLLATSAERRQAMLALYMWCHESDNRIDALPRGADASTVIIALRNELHALYASEAQPPTPLMRTLARSIHRYQLPHTLFEDIITGLEMDAEHQMFKPKKERLEQYCYRVASAVGLLSIRIWDCTSSQTDSFAIALGQMMQRINVLRDVQEDAALNRVYLPAEYLETAGISDINVLQLRKPDAALHKKLCIAYEMMAADALAYRDAALATLTPEDTNRLLPAFLMASIYLYYLEQMKQRGWSFERKDLRLPPREKLRLVQLSIALKLGYEAAPARFLRLSM